jgi:hypothetical protein
MRLQVFTLSEPISLLVINRAKPRLRGSRTGGVKFLRHGGAKRVILIRKGLLRRS